MYHMTRLLLTLSCIISIYGLAASTPLMAQQPSSETTADLSVFFDTAKVYPSLTPRTYIKVGFGAIFDPTTRTFNEASPATYLLQKLDATGNPTGDIFHPERVDVVTVRGQIQGEAYLYLDAKSRELKAGDKMRVGILTQFRTPTGGTRPVTFWNTDSITVPTLDNYTLQLEPDIVPEQELVDGTKKSVGHLKLRLDVPSLIANRNVARFYFVTDNLFSTNGKDKSSKVDLKFGAERTLLNSWYVPGNIETNVTGDQRFSNSSFKLSSGVKTILPWAWTKSLLFNSFVKAPISPEFQVSAQYQRWLRQDAATRKKFPDKNNFMLSAQMAWNPIHLLTGKGFSTNDISLELLGKGWWFPYQRTSSGTRVQKLEGRFEMSLLIPVGKLTTSDAGILSFLKKPDSGMNNRIRVKFIRGANEATGFKHVSQISVGIETSK
jgi:hypothetical protein